MIVCAGAATRHQDSEARYLRMLMLRLSYGLLSALLMTCIGCAKGDGGAWKPFAYDVSGDYFPGPAVIAYKAVDFEPNRKDGCNHFAFKLASGTRVDTFDYARDDDGGDGILWEGEDKDLRCDAVRLTIDGDEVWYCSEGFEAKIPKKDRSGFQSMSFVNVGQHWDWTAWHYNAYVYESESVRRGE